MKITPINLKNESGLTQLIRMGEFIRQIWVKELIKQTKLTLYFLLQGSNVQVQVKNGIVYEGVLKTFSPKVNTLSLVLQCLMSYSLVVTFSAIRHKTNVILSDFK